eukprot:XP_016876048.1 transmembrane protein 255B isoform X3 [Homo sapiens]
MLAALSQIFEKTGQVMLQRCLPNASRRTCCSVVEVLELGFGSFLGIIGINLVENRRQMLVAAIVFISFGVVAAFCCAIVDGVFAAQHIISAQTASPSVSTLGVASDCLSSQNRGPSPREDASFTPVGWGTCTMSTRQSTRVRGGGAGGPLSGQHLPACLGLSSSCREASCVTCHSLDGKCQLKVRSNTCYCCDLYACGSAEPSPAYYEFIGVSGCQDVLHLYRLLWASAVLNVLGLFLGIITAAVLGAFKDMVPLSQLAYGPAVPPQTLYNPAQQILAYAGFRLTPEPVPTCSSYPLPLQPCSRFPVAPSSALASSEDLQPPSPSSSGSGLPGQAPPCYAPTYFPPGEKPPPYAP